MLADPINASAITPRTPSPRTVANSLFLRILPVSPFSSRFCPDQLGSEAHKSFKTRILKTQRKKIKDRYQDLEPSISSPEGESRKPVADIEV